jgi:hypothetical protein
MKKSSVVQGKGHLTGSGKLIRDKSVKIKDCSKCIFKCNEQVSLSECQDIFNDFWELGSKERQKDFICARVEEHETNMKCCTAPKRTSARKYYLNGKHVCKDFFRQVLDVSDNFIKTAMMNRSESGVYSPPRQERSAHNKTNEEILSERIHKESS